MINSLGGSGGAEQGLVREITRFGSDVDQMVVRLFAKDQLSGTLHEHSIRTESIELRPDQSSWNWTIARSRLRKIMAEYRADVVHSSLFTSNLAAQVATRPLGIPVLSTFTNSGTSELIREFQPGARSWRAGVLRGLAARAGRGENIRYRAMTIDARDTNCHALGIETSRCVVIPRGVPPFEVPDPLTSREDLGLPGQGPLVLNVARQAAQKGQIHLLRSFRDVLQSHQAHLVVLGRKGDASDQIEKAITELDLEASVSLIGYSPHVDHYYAHADVFVFSSLMEGLGTAVIEAMSARLPVVAFDIPPIHEVTDGGRVASLVPVGDEDQLAQAIVKALGGDGADVEEAAAWVESRFSLAEVSRSLEARLREVAGVG